MQCRINIILIIINFVKIYLIYSRPVIKILKQAQLIPVNNIYLQLLKVCSYIIVSFFGFPFLSTIIWSDISCRGHYGSQVNDSYEQYEETFLKSLKMGWAIKALSLNLLACCSYHKTSQTWLAKTLSWSSLMIVQPISHSQKLATDLSHFLEKSLSKTFLEHL